MLRLEARSYRIDRILQAPICIYDISSHRLIMHYSEYLSYNQLSYSVFGLPAIRREAKYDNPEFVNSIVIYNMYWYLHIVTYEY